MTTATFNAASALDAASRPAKPSFFKRLVAAMAESRRRQAEIIIRQHLALRGEPRERLDYALLPFAGE
jgi:DNA-binding FadR family transcriptional regulator